MQVFNQPSQSEWPVLIQRPYIDNSAITETVAKIIATVAEQKDQALFDMAKRFDKVELTSLKVTEEEFIWAGWKVDERLKTAIMTALDNIGAFHSAQLQPENIVEPKPGIKCWRKSVAIEKVGFYIPGGSAPLFSTVLMLAVPALMAGCRDIILCSPPDKEGNIHPAILFAASLLRIRQVYKVGGAQAIAAMAYGTNSIPAVHKIFGPGNQYVTVAKQFVQNKVAIDMPAGPSEVLVIADDTADPSFVAADLLSQAEHGPDSQVILVTTSEWISAEVLEKIEEHKSKLPRASIAEETLAKSRIIILSSLEAAIRFSNEYAPEHLILACRNANELATQVTNAGSVFIGHYSPESAGDYASGTNHTLPTNGYARMYSGVSVDSFVKKITFQQLTKEGLQLIGPTVMTMAEAEGLDAHKLAVEVRMEKIVE